MIFLIFGFSIYIGLSLLFFTPIITFFGFYSYPSSQRKSLEKEINQELPFVTIYLSAIATSGIEPSKIFEIVVRTKESGSQVKVKDLARVELGVETYRMKTRLNASSPRGFSIPLSRPDPLPISGWASPNRQKSRWPIL